MYSGDFSLKAAASIYDDIYVQASIFSACKFSFCNRETNCVAYRLYRETDTLPNVWVGHPPSFLVPLLIDDVSVI
jgi:hypothetical protein